MLQMVLGFLLAILFSCQSSIVQSGMQKDTVEILSLNIFDQQQGQWDEHFRGTRLRALASRLDEWGDSLELVFLQESQAAINNDGQYASQDAHYLSKNFPYHYYTHESIEKDGMSYGYLVLSKKKPTKIWKNSFHFQGGSKRVVQLSLWNFQKIGCLGVANIHLSWQGSRVRYEEVQFLVSKMPQLKSHCSNWIFLGDFNADENSDEMKFLFNNGFNKFSAQPEATVGPFNPIRSIYGKIKNQTIDWIIGTDTLSGQTKVLLNRPVKGVWVSDHAAVIMTLESAK